MTTLNLLIVGSALIILLLLWVIVGVRHLKYLKRQIGEQWEILDESLRKRHNLLPNLIETVRVYDSGQEVLLNKMIDGRIRAAKEYNPGAKKIEYEHDLSQVIDEVIALSKGNDELKTDTNFLELRKDIDDLEKNIELKADKYNEMVRYFNGHIKNPFLMPLASVFHFGIQNIFEVET